MPYYLSQKIKENLPGLWFEGEPYVRENIYKIEEGKLPPVNYDSHILKSHSLTHMEVQSHTVKNGAKIEDFFVGNYLWGKCRVIRLKGNNYKKVDDEIYHWEIRKEEILPYFSDFNVEKVIITSDFYPENKHGYHDPSYVLTLSKEAALFLSSDVGINLYGTSWKSSDFCPGSVDRPIHNILFERAVILECLDLREVPEGDYFISVGAIRISEASEVPASPILFSKEELLNAF